MTNEYLFTDDKHRDEVEKYKPESATVKIANIAETSLWTASFSVVGQGEDAAHKLSNIHLFVMKYSPMVLSCQSSEYYNKRLFPLINALERQLRKLLYVTASISNDQKAKDSIQRLEEKDFGEIFNILFIDQNFITNLKKRVNADSKSEFNGMGLYSKKEIAEYLKKLEEAILWNKIRGDIDVPTLRMRFRDVQKYRNAVMHAHNISKKEYKKAKYLFSKVNSELEIALKTLLEMEGSDKVSQAANVGNDVNEFIAYAIDSNDLAQYSKEISQAINNRLNTEAMNSFLAEISDVLMRQNFLNQEEIISVLPEITKVALKHSFDVTPIVDAMKINMPSYGDGFSKIVQSLKELQGRVNLPQIDTSALESIRER